MSTQQHPEWLTLEPPIDPADATEFDLEWLLKTADLFSNIINARDPVYTSGTLAIDTDRPAGVLFVSCAHLGGRSTEHKTFFDFMQRVLATPNLYVFLMGDETEGYIAGFPDVMAVHQQPLSIDLQVALNTRIVRDLSAAGRLLGVLSGQHSGQWMERRYGSNPIKQAALDAGLPYFDGQAYVKLMVGPEQYNIALAHKFPGHSLYNPLHGQIRAMHWEVPSADVIAQGDHHVYAMAEMSAFVREYDAGMRASPYVWLIQAGTAKTGPDKYTIRGWSRGLLAWPVLVFHPETHFIEGARSLDALHIRLGGA